MEMLSTTTKQNLKRTTTMAFVALGIGLLLGLVGCEGGNSSLPSDNTPGGRYGTVADSKADGGANPCISTGGAWDNADGFCYTTTWCETSEVSDRHHTPDGNPNTGLRPTGSDCSNGRATFTQASNTIRIAVVTSKTGEPLTMVCVLNSQAFTWYC